MCNALTKNTCVRVLELKVYHFKYLNLKNLHRFLIFQNLFNQIVN